jgi:isopenicillin N synthase-like dioxygenase
MSIDQVPVIDLSGDLSVAVRTLDKALRKFGFFYVTGTGILDELVAAQFDIASKLFQLSHDEKEKMSFDSMLDIGYVGAGVQTLDPNGKVQHSGDTKEQFMMTNNSLISAEAVDSDIVCDPMNVFQGSQNYKPNVPGHATVTRDYTSAVYRLNQQLNSLLFESLQLSPEDRKRLGSAPFIVLKQMRYRGEKSDATCGKFGAGAHADWGAFTILATDSTPGLQIHMEEGWLPVPPKPNCFIINSGDQIAQLTNNFYRSAIHRVVTTSTQPRFSTAVFTYFNMNAEVAPLDQFVSDSHPACYPCGRTSLQYFHYKLHQSMGTKKSGKQGYVEMRNSPTETTALA